MEIKEDIDYDDSSSIYRFEMANKAGSSNYGDTDEISLGRGGFSSKELNTRSGQLEDVTDSSAAVPAYAGQTDSDDYDDGGFDTDSQDDENY